MDDVTKALCPCCGDWIEHRLGLFIVHPGPADEGPDCEGSELPIRVCRICGCDDGDCGECIAATGEACHWVEDDLCSRCQPGVIAAAAEATGLPSVFFIASHKELMQGERNEKKAAMFAVHYVPGPQSPRQCDRCDPSRVCYDGKEVCLEEEGAEAVVPMAQPTTKLLDEPVPLVGTLSIEQCNAMLCSICGLDVGTCLHTATEAFLPADHPRLIHNWPLTFSPEEIAAAAMAPFQNQILGQWMPTEQEEAEDEREARVERYLRRDLGPTKNYKVSRALPVSERMIRRGDVIKVDPAELAANNAWGVCPNCEQWQRPPFGDCLHECAKRGFADAARQPDGYSHKCPPASLSSPYTFCACHRDRDEAMCCASCFPGKPALAPDTRTDREILADTIAGTGDRDDDIIVKLPWPGAPDGTKTVRMPQKMITGLPDGEDLAKIIQENSVKDVSMGCFVKEPAPGTLPTVDLSSQITIDNEGIWLKENGEDLDELGSQHKVGRHLQSVPLDPDKKEK
jgi:hypothetical protein